MSLVIESIFIYFRYKKWGIMRVIYQAFDGTAFETKKECETYENYYTFFNNEVKCYNIFNEEINALPIDSNINQIKKIIIDSDIAAIKFKQYILDSSKRPNRMADMLRFMDKAGTYIYILECDAFIKNMGLYDIMNMINNEAFFDDSNSQFIIKKIDNQFFAYKDC